jgi:hypothetical protein
MGMMERWGRSGGGWVFEFYLCVIVEVDMVGMGGRLS